jgi:hypothetical protein
MRQISAYTKLAIILFKHTELAYFRCFKKVKLKFKSVLVFIKELNLLLRNS